MERDVEVFMVVVGERIELCEVEERVCGGLELFEVKFSGACV